MTAISNLKMWREYHEKTQAWMAEELGVSQSTYSRFENNFYRKRYKYTKMERLASEMTGIPVEELHKPARWNEEKLRMIEQILQT
jgi:transcriptional regulator with XRE-family HTH domain